jgi:hypothetical protein
MTPPPCAKRVSLEKKYRCAKRVLPDGSCFWLTNLWLRSELKRAGGRALSLSSRPPAVEGSLDFRVLFFGCGVIGRVSLLSTGNGSKFLFFMQVSENFKRWLPLHAIFMTGG